MTRPILPAVLLATTLLVACASDRPPDFAYDDAVPPLPSPPVTAPDDRTRPLHVPPAWTPSRGGEAAATPVAQVGNANAAARVEPRQAGYFNAIQIYPWSEGALYQVYAAPGQITAIALEPGERLAGTGPIAAGDTARWIIGDTESGAGRDTRVLVLVKPTRPDISTNLVISTDRRTHLIELNPSEETWMPAIAWAYPRAPDAPGLHRPRRASRPRMPAITATGCRATPRPGGRSRSSMTGAGSMSSSRAASPRAKCRRSSSSGPMANWKSSTRASTAMC